MNATDYKYGTGYDDPSAPPKICNYCGGYRSGVAKNPDTDCSCKWPKYGPKFRSKYGFWLYWSAEMNCYVSIPDEADYE